MNEEYDKAESKRLELQNLLDQLGDFETMRELGIISEGELINRRARHSAFTHALGIIGAGEEITDIRIAELLESARISAAQPTVIECLSSGVSDCQNALAELGVISTDNAVALGDVMDAVAELGVIVAGNQ